MTNCLKNTFRFMGCSNRAIKFVEKLSVYEVEGDTVQAQYIKDAQEGIIKFPVYQSGPINRCFRSGFKGLMAWFPVIVILLHAVSYWMIRQMQWYTIDPSGDIENHYTIINKSGIVFHEKKSTVISVGQFNVSELNDTLAYFFNTLVILFPLFFMNRISKFQTSRMLFQSLCGDVKAMSIYLCSLTSDDQKYLLKNENDKDSQLQEIKQETFYYYIKMRYMLCVLPPVAKHVLRKDANLELLDDKFRVKSTKICSFGGPWTKYEPSLEPWGSNKANKLEHALYRQLKEIIDESGVDLFEASMLVVLDLIHEIRVRELGYNGGIERDFIGCWNKIYGAWGPLYTNHTSQPPTLVNALFYITFLAYSIVVPWTNLDKDPWSGYASSFILVFFFSLMLWIGRVIQDPFQRSRLCCRVNPSISKDSRDTQKQVYYLLKNLAVFDQSYHRGYDVRKGFSQKGLQQNIFNRNGSNINDLKKPRRGRRDGIYGKNTRYRRNGVRFDRGEINF